MHLVGFVVRITMDVWSSPCGHQNVGLCTVKNRYNLVVIKEVIFQFLYLRVCVSGEET